MSVLDALRDGWAWTEINFAEVHAVSRMGHLLFSDADGCFHYLDPELRTIEVLGDEQAARAYFDKEETRKVWQAIPLVEAARERLGECPEGSVYTLKPLALLEEDYAHENLCILPLKELISWTGDVTRQLKDLPDGSQYRIQIVD